MSKGVIKLTFIHFIFRHLELNSYRSRKKSDKFQVHEVVHRDCTLDMGYYLPVQLNPYISKVFPLRYL